MSCRAITRSGACCTRSAAPGFIYCAQHCKQTTPHGPPVKRVRWRFCGAETRRGTACQNPVPRGCFTCDRHREVALRASADGSRSAVAPAPSTEGSVAPALMRVAAGLKELAGMGAPFIHRNYCAAIADAAFLRDPARAEFLRLCGVPE